MNHNELIQMMLHIKHVADNLKRSGMPNTPELVFKFDNTNHMNYAYQRLEKSLLESGMYMYGNNNSTVRTLLRQWDTIQFKVADILVTFTIRGVN